MTQTSPSTAAVVELLEEIRHLMELKGENPFKIRAFEKAATLLGAPDFDEDLAARAKAGSLTEIAGIGKGLSEVLTDFLLRGTSSVRDELKSSLPDGLLELTLVPGLGPKKAMTLIEKLGIHSISELEYACRENRLLKLKGFGEKAQAKILEAASFIKSNEGRRRLGDVEVQAAALRDVLSKAAKGARVCETGSIRRKMETISSLDYIIELLPDVKEASLRTKLEDAARTYCSEGGLCLPVHFHFARPEQFGFEWARTTGTAEHWCALGSPKPFDASVEEEFFKHLRLPMIPPEARETGEEVALAKKGALDKLLPWNGIRGVFHNHTTRSDGNATLEQMVVAAKKLGYEYIGISDHSQTAFYAQGLKVPDLLEQEREVKELQQKHPEIRIFWGIESDILADGSLDYEHKVLKRFDFVVASIHSRFNMDREAMTDRILAAIRNPSTRFLGHATGRLLLGRKGYEVDMERIIEEASKHDVAIEINANPARLDIDWRWGPQLRKCATPVAVNPDAHETAGLEDTNYGIAMARKALLPASQVVNSGSVRQVEKWLKRE